MTRNLITLSLFVCTTTLVFVNCSKERIEAVKQYSPVATYLDTKKQAEQEIIIDSSGTAPIVGKQGTKIWTGKQCLMFPNGDSVTWPFTVKLVELYTPKDMIYYQMPTVSAGTVMKTDGEIKLTAFKNGTELVLKPDPCMAQIEMPNAAPQANMRVFYGINTTIAPITYVDWTDDPTKVGVTTSLSPLFTTNTTGYSAFIAKLGWINCGMLAGSSASSTLTFTSSTDDLTNVGIFVYIPATKTVIQVYNLSSTAIPNGSAVKIIAIGIDASGNLFSAYQEATVSANTTVDVTLGATTDADLTSLLDKL